jgi:hypothetical protein
MPRAEYPDLLTALLHAPLVVARVVDRSAEFLRFLELHALWNAITIEARVPASDAVALRCDRAERLIIGAGAAAKILVNVLA